MLTGSVDGYLRTIVFFKREITRRCRSHDAAVIPAPPFVSSASLHDPSSPCRRRWTLSRLAL
jgi:hypothetical protein